MYKIISILVFKTKFSPRYGLLLSFRLFWNSNLAFMAYFVNIEIHTSWTKFTNMTVCRMIYIFLLWKQMSSFGDSFSLQLLNLPTLFPCSNSTTFLNLIKSGMILKEAHTIMQLKYALLTK